MHNDVKGTLCHGDGNLKHKLNFTLVMIELVGNCIFLVHTSRKLNNAFLL